MQSFRTLSFIEGVSLILLLCVAMPLKFLFGYGSPLFYVGLAYGVLFFCYLVSALAVANRQGWSVGYSLLVISLGVVPLGCVWLCRHVKRGSQEAFLPNS